MADTEVENILREIRERVRAEQQQSAALSGSSQELGVNGYPVRSNEEHPPMSAEALARIEGHLTTTARAWDRLPPVVSNRSGTRARLELWVKRRLKRATRWYAWEQINFNAAVHHALSDMLEAFSAYELQLQRMRAETEALARKIEQSMIELQAERRIGLAELAQEQRNRDDRLLDEQRVCLKQLSLEISEASTLFDRARREIESRLDKLETAKTNRKS